MTKFLLLVGFIFLFTACSSKEVYPQKKVYDKVSKDAVLEAGKKIFILADKESFQIDSYRNKIEVRKRNFNYKVMSTSLSVDKWLLEVVEDKNKLRVFLELERVDAFDDNEKLEINKKRAYELFWSRLDYLLGFKENWVSCYDYNYLLVSSDNSLCDSVKLNSRDANKNDLIKNVFAKDRRKEIYTVETIDADVFKFTDLSIIKKKDDVLEEKKSSLVKEESEEQKQINKEAQKELEEFKKDISTIINSSKKIEELDIDGIIEDSNNIKETSEFILEEDDNSDDKLDKLDKIK